MVFPLYDDNADRRTFPFVNYALIVLNVLVFIFPQGMSERGNKFTYAFSCVPKEIVTGEDLTEVIEFKHPITKETIEAIQLEPTPISVYITLLTSMFMHGGLAHLIGNMLFLWIFGDNVEDYLGHVRYVIFYLICGVAASFAHIAVTYGFGMDPRIPCLGASGAISGVLGGYLLLYPHKSVAVILLRIITTVPAWVAIGMWFLFQIINSLGALGDKTGGGVAYGAHIGGFIAGLVLVKLIGVGVDPPPRALPPRRRF
ncbi:MAG: rhomboid family intramembrane serine protease [Gemmataceae bacterium]|nr:rhomboid family intramembrane serine protease [Gemmataceae bacterium]